MEIRPGFSLTPDGYEAPEVKLEIKLKAYDKPPTTKTPVLTGYVKVTKQQLKSIERVINASEGGNLTYLRVALWDSKTEEGGVDGVIEYREYTPPAKSTDTKQQSNKWY